MQIKAFLINALVLILISTVVVRAVYRYFVPLQVEREAFLSFDSDAASVRMQYLMDKDGSFDVPLHTSYNFNSMLDLIDAAKEVKRKIGNSFRISRKQGYKTIASMDADMLHALLRQLQRERSELRDYVLDLKGSFRAGIPFNKNRSLQYYMQVLEESIVDIKDLMRSYFEAKSKEKRQQNERADNNS